MRCAVVWLGVALCLLLCACAGVSSHAGAALVPPQPRDCEALFPHPQAPAVDVSAGVLPSGLADAGAGRLQLSRFYKCREDNLTDRNKYMVALSEGLLSDQRRMKADVDAYKQHLAAAQAESDDYNASCQAPGLTESQYQACMTRQQQVNQDIAAVTALYPDLQRRKAEQDAKITAYNQDLGALPDEIQAAYQDYKAAIDEQGRWLDTARNLIVSPANQATVAGAACPSVQKAATTVPEMEAMTEDLVACLRRMPATLLVPPSAAAPTAVDSAGSVAAPHDSDLDSRGTGGI